MKEALQGLLRRLEKSRFALALQFIKFGIVGVSNTLISYSIEMLCYYAIFAGAAWNNAVKIAVTSVLAFMVSVTNSYYWNNRYVFGQDEKKPLLQHLVSYIKTVICYGVTGLMLAPMLKVWMSDIGIPYWAASLGTLIVTIPINFVFNKFWAFRSRKA